MGLALEKSDMSVNDLSVVKVADTVKSVGDSFSVVIPVAEVQGFGLDVAINLGVEFNLPRDRSPSVHSPPREETELVFEVGILRRVETSAETCGAFERDGYNGRVETNHRHARQ